MNLTNVMSKVDKQRGESARNLMTTPGLTLPQQQTFGNTKVTPFSKYNGVVVDKETINKKTLFKAGF